MDPTPTRRRSPVRVADCNLAASFEILGDRWSLLIVRSALFGVRRFDDFRTELDIPRNVLSDRLKRLVETGILIRRDYREGNSRARPEYVLTEMGQSLRLPFLAMRQWADAWIRTDRPPPLTIVRRSDGVSVRADMRDALDRPVPSDDLAFAVADWVAQETGRPDLPGDESQHEGEV